MDSTARSTSRSGQYKWCALGSWTLVILRTEASRNHGKSLNGTNNSRSARKSQNPCGETLVTSTGEVFRPSVADFIQMLLDQLLRFGYLLRFEAKVRGKLDDRFNPEFRFAV